MNTTTSHYLPTVSTPHMWSVWFSWSWKCILIIKIFKLSPNKGRVFQEAFRVLKDGGRLAISDIVMTASLPEELQSNMQLYSGCISGASTIEVLTELIHQAGFKNISIIPKGDSKEFIKEWVPEHKVEEYIVSAIIKAKK